MSFRRQNENASAEPRQYRARRLLLSIAVCAAALTATPVAAQFKYRTDPSPGNRGVQDGDSQSVRTAPVRTSKDGKPEIWFGRPRGKTPGYGDETARPKYAIPEGGGAVLNIPWAKPPIPGEPSPKPRPELSELDEERIVVEDSQIRFDHDGNFVIDLYCRVVGSAPAKFVTVAGLTRTGETFVNNDSLDVKHTTAWKVVERGESDRFLMSLPLEKHFSTRRFKQYLVKFYHVEDFEPEFLPQD